MHPKYKKHKNCQGQYLLELLFAVAIISLVLIGVVSLSVRSVSNQTFASNKELATEYGQEATEWIRAERDADWPAFAGRGTVGGSVYCLSDLSWLHPGPCAGAGSEIAGTIFYRETTLTLNAPDSMRILVEVSWQDSQGNHNVVSETLLTDWN